MSADLLHWPMWVFALLPVSFVLCDIAEDLQISSLLLWTQRINRHSVALAKATTKAKMFACGLAILQTMVVSAVGLLVA